MCIFSQPVLSVNNTQIFGRITSRQTQFLAYQMNYESRNETAMILPIPIRQPANDTRLRFVDLHDYTDFFKDLDAGFPYTPPSFNIGCSAPFDSASADALAVFEIGNYVASFVPTLADFSRLDDRFTLPKATWAQIPQYASYGFAVFQFASGALRSHPMAFEFEHDNDSIYFPTRHIHDGQVHKAEAFDHTLYMQHAGFDSRVYGYQNSDVSDQSTGLVRSKHTAKQFCDIESAAGVILPDLLVHRKVMRGVSPNRDTHFATFGDPSHRTLNLRPLNSYMPWLVVTAVVSWFFARRMKLKKTKTSNKFTD